MAFMLGWRLLISAILIPLLLGLFYADHRLGLSAPLLALFAALLSIRSAWELGHLFGARGYPIRSRLQMTGSCATALSAWIPAWCWASPVIDGAPLASLGPMALSLALCLLIVFMQEAAHFQAPGKTFESLGASLLVIAYSGFLLGITSQLRWVAGSEAGYLVLGSLLIAAKTCDIGAYTFGRLFGKTKMSPVLSPGKTWAGAVGGIATSTVSTWAWLTFMPHLFNAEWQPSPAWAACVYGAVVGLTGMVGDLMESLLKRDAGKKDSAALLPGFGGLLDLLDSVLYAGPVAYALWVWLPLQSW
jgi:phosphatidate cytidylyltransferase